MKMKNRAEQYFGMWAILEDRLGRYTEMTKSLDLAALAQTRAAGSVRTLDATDVTVVREVKWDGVKLEASTANVSPSSPLPTESPDIADDDEDEPYYTMSDNIAVMDISGPLTKYPTCFQQLFGGTAMLVVQNAIRQANADDAVDAIVLHIESPGGTVAGTYELAAAVKASGKPVLAYISDLGASAAYWIASQSSFVACSPTAMVGSIGTLMVLQDSSGAYAKEGIKVIPVGTGKFKGAGTEGAEITPDQIAYFQSLATEINAHFVGAVSEARKLTPVQIDSVKDAGVYIGAKAVDVGLVDQVMAFDEFMQHVSGQITKQENDMTPEEMKTLTDKAFADGYAAATDRLNKLVALADGRTAFALEQFAKGHDEAKAATELNTVLKAELAAAKQAAVEATADGHPGIGLAAKSAKSSDDVQKDFMAIVEKKVKDKKLSKAEAMKQAVAEHPSLYAEWQETFKAATGPKAGSK
jgi:signal peptide peptidase SppA